MNRLAPFLLFISGCLLASVFLGLLSTVISSSASLTESLRQVRYEPFQWVTTTTITTATPTTATSHSSPTGTRIRTRSTSAATSSAFPEKPVPELWNAGGLLVDTLEGMPGLPVISKDETRSDRRLQKHSSDASITTSLPDVTPPSTMTAPLQLLNHETFKARQGFSATWWQSVDRFRRMPVHDISYCEDATFKAIFMGEAKEFRLTVDWTNFAVEHLSYWWKTARYDVSTPAAAVSHSPTRPVANAETTTVTVATNATADGMSTPPMRSHGTLARILRNLVHYTLRVLAPRTHDDDGKDNMVNYKNSKMYGAAPSPADTETTVTQQTLALVAYLPYKSKIRHTDAAIQLTIANVAASFAALLQHDWGRIVLVCDVEDEEHTRQHIWPAVVHLLQTALGQGSAGHHDDQDNDRFRLVSFIPEQLLKDVQQRPLHSGTDYSDTIFLRNSQIKLVVTSTRHYHKMYGHQKMVPRKAVLDAHHALFGFPSRSSNATEIEEYKEFQAAWLGKDPQQWKYVYLTEPDIILLTKKHFLSQVQPYLDQGLVFLPHRLQPVPHEFDFRHTAPSVDDEADVPTDPAPGLYVPAVGNWSTVRSLTADDHACCEAGLSFNPHEIYGRCSVFWFLCGFASQESLPPAATDRGAMRTQAPERWKRLSHFRFVQYLAGTRLATLTGSEAGRVCIPRHIPTQGPCPDVPLKGKLAFDPMNASTWLSW